MIKTNNLIKKYPEKQIGPMNLTFDLGSITAIIGRSGSGKSTLIKMISSIIDPSSGEVFYENGLSKEDITYINQGGTLFNHLTIKENLNLTFKGEDKRIVEVLKNININERYLNLYPFELSGGEKQRIDIARAILSNSKVLVLDEIFSALDSKIKDEISILIKNIRDKYNIMVLIITHDIYDALFISNRILIIDEGKVIYDDESENLVRADNKILEKVFSNRQIDILKKGVL